MTGPLEIIATDRGFVVARAPDRPHDESRPPGYRRQPPGQRVLLLHVVPRQDPAQWLHVGAYRVCAWEDGSYRLKEQGLILRDDASEIDRETAERYAEDHRLIVRTRDEFCRQVLVGESYRLGTLTVAANLPFTLGRLSIGCGPGRGRFHSGFLLRLCAKPWIPRVRVRTVEGEMVFVEWSGYYTDPQHPRTEPPGHRIFRGRWLDLAQWSTVLCGDDGGGDLAVLCERWGVDADSVSAPLSTVLSEATFDAVSQSLETAWLLFDAMREEWNRWCPPCVPLPAPPPKPGARPEESPDLNPEAILPHHLHSPASLGKKLFACMGLRGLLEAHPNVPESALGAAMAGFLGGRAEGHILHTVLPVVAYDLTATYPTLGALLNLWSLVTAKRIEMQDVTAETQAILDRVALDDLLRPEPWPGLVVLCRLYPTGDVLPEKAEYEAGTDPTVGVNPTTVAAGIVRWRWLADLVASKLLTGRAPRIEQALRPVVIETQADLRPVRFREFGLFDPRRDGYCQLLRFRLQVRAEKARAEAQGDVERARALGRLNDFLKKFENSVGYGIFVQYTETHRGARVADVWTGDRHFTCPLIDPKTKRRIRPEESPGEFFNPFVAGPITSAARLLLAMMERMVRDAGGTWALMDTDSIQLVSTRGGGFVDCPGGPHQSPNGRQAVRALSHSEAEAIRARFDALAPCGGRLWKVEAENAPHPEATRDPQLYSLVVGTKQYVLFNRRDTGGVIIRKASEHCLGHLRPPEGWTKTRMIDAIWAALIAFADGDAEAIDRLPFAHRLALGSYPVTRPEYLARLHAALPRPRRGQPTRDPLLPFGDMYIAYPRWSLDDVCPVTLAGPDPEAPRARWVDLGSGRPLDLWWEAWPGRERSGGIEVQTFKDAAALHRAAVDRRYLGPDGAPHEAFQAGELQRRPVHIVGVAIIGKESRRLSEAQHGLLPAAEMAVRYEGAPDDETLRHVLRSVPMWFLCAYTGLHHSTIQRYRNGRTRRLRPEHARALWGAVAAWVSLRLKAGLILPQAMEDAPAREAAL